MRVSNQTDLDAALSSGLQAEVHDCTSRVVIRHPDASILVNEGSPSLSVEASRAKLIVTGGTPRVRVVDPFSLDVTAIGGFLTLQAMDAGSVGVRLQGAANGRFEITNCSYFALENVGSGESIATLSDVDDSEFICDSSSRLVLYLNGGEVTVISAFNRSTVNLNAMEAVRVEVDAYHQAQVSVSAQHQTHVDVRHTCGGLVRIHGKDGDSSITITAPPPPAAVHGLASASSPLAG